MEGELQHFFHEHPLVLKAEQPKTRDGTNKTDREISCDGCSAPISGPFYSCKECRYYLHKVCAELPSALDHPLHRQHPLALLRCSPYSGNHKCNLCSESGSKFVYHCSVCSFDVDMKCASATHVIHDKCHPHPLTPVQVPIAFDCHVCLKKAEGLSYKCNICPFWVHQNCTLIPDAVRHSDHKHLLTLFPSVPLEYNRCEQCDICHSKLFMFQCNYSCVGCLFFAHVSCARLETTQSTSRDQKTDGQNVVHLPMKQDSTELISRCVGNHIDGDANIDNKIDDPFFHEHPLILIDEKTASDKTCEACAIRISSPSYGCVECDYFLHKCCTDLPKQIRHPAHPEHQLALRSTPRFIKCYCCEQWCNSFFYKCSECEDFNIDIKCGTILEGTVVYHEAHKHPLLIQKRKPWNICTACGLLTHAYSFPNEVFNYTILQCNTCSFELCYVCAMTPRVIKHRYGKSEPFRLTYSAPENHYDDYLCELCMVELNPKRWYYHCLFADQFAHTRCMLWCGADSNIKYGKSYVDEEEHEHEVTMVSSTYDCSSCSRCRHPMRTGLFACVGFECKTCNYRRHLWCPNQ